MTESTKFTPLRLDLAGFSGKRCFVVHRSGSASYGTIAPNTFNAGGGLNQSYPWWLNSEDGASETYTSQGTVMKSVPHPGDIILIEERAKPEPDQRPQLEDRVTQLESKLETLLRHFHELSSEL